MLNVNGEYIVIINNINFFTVIATVKSFSFNLNIFETNIVNLSIVVIVLFQYGSVALATVLKNRKDTVTKTLQDLEEKALEWEKILTLATENLNLAKVKAEQIRLQSISLSSQASKSILYSVDEDIKRLRNVSLLSLIMEEKKSLKEICQKLSKSSLKKASEILSKNLNPKFHKKIVSKNVEKLSRKSLKFN